MSLKREHISVRTTRLNNLILGNPQATSKTNKVVADALSREGLLDALYVLYNECNKDALKKRDRNVSEFTSKYRSIIQEANTLRVNSDDFKIKAQIGQGYFGNVYLVEEKTTGDIYAMKKIKKSGVTNSQVKEERDIMAKRSSEWITSLQYAFQDIDNLYLVMEYLPGGDLLSLMIRNGPFDEDLAKFYLAELTLALNALHTMGYVHRDIKPENILIDRFGHIKLGDFGNAATLDKHGNVTSLSPVGTPDYIAPELLQTISSSKLSKSIHDVKCDYWSMGVIGYELIFETTPFHEDNVHETYSKILSHCDDSNAEIIPYPPDIKITSTFKSLLEGLIIKPTVRLTYEQIIKHKFFEDIKWDKLRYQVPPIIPTVNGNDDISNFEDIERTKARRSTFIKRSISSNIKSNEFIGKDLPFLGYGFIHEEIINDYSEIYDEKHIAKLNNKIKELQKINKGHNDEIKMLQEKLLKAERTTLQSDSLNKILKDSKEELNKIKEKLKEKTIELASCRTEIKTLQSSLKIEEEMRLKNEATISEVLSSTYQKWEKAKMMSDQNYEKQIAEKKTEISNITQKLLARETELTAKSEECTHLHKKLENYKEMLKSIKDRNSTDKLEFEKAKQQLIDAYENKIKELTKKLKIENDTKTKLSTELRDIRNELDESICSTNSSKQAKLATERNMELMKERLNQEVEFNNELRSQNALLQKKLTDNEKSCELHKSENEKLKEELQLIECKKKIEHHNRHQQQQLEEEHSSPYQTAHGSLTELSAIEEQLRSDLQLAKEQEDQQRKRADQLEKAVNSLETLVTKLKEQVSQIQTQPLSSTIVTDTGKAPTASMSASIGDMLEKKNEKLEDQLAAAREQAIVERQSARAANLSLWKLEKQLEDVSFEKKAIKTKLDSAEEKCKKIQMEKSELQLKFKGIQDIVKQRELKITELKEEISNLKLDLQKEHRMWEKSEQERMKEKSENIENVSKRQQIEEKCEELKQKIKQLSQRNDGLNLENKRLMREINEEHEKTTNLTEQLNELQMKMKSLQQNYELLKTACTVTDTQLSELEVMLDTEQKQNKTNQEKIDNLWKNINSKDEQIAKLKQNIDTETLLRSAAENKVKSLLNDKGVLEKNLEDIRKQLIEQQNELISKTTSLFESQEKIELQQSEISNLQVINGNYEKQILILKEENSRILSDLFVAKEDFNNLSRDFKLATQTINELKQEIEQSRGTISELKAHYMQREFKAESTISQQKNLIDYLQTKVEEYQQKKKKTLADKIFGGGSSGLTSSSKKENISPNAIEASFLYKNLQEELKKEKQINKELTDEISKLKKSEHSESKDILTHSKSPAKREIKDHHVEAVVKTQDQQQHQLHQQKEEQHHHHLHQKQQQQQHHHQQQQQHQQHQQQQQQQQQQQESERKRESQFTSTSSSSDSHSINQVHRFELTLENLPENCGACIVCCKPIVVGSPYFNCKECKGSVHRKCRSNVQSSCDGFEAIQPAPLLTKHDENISSSSSTDRLSSDENNSDKNTAIEINNYPVKILLKSDITSTPLEINCVFEILEDIILLGCKTGLFAYHLNTKSLVNIAGIDGVICIATTERLSKAILIGSNGECLYQCDLRHLHNRSQASACLKPKLETIVLDLPFANRTHDEKWHLTKISNETENAIDTIALAATSTRIVIMKYDLHLQRFKPVRALDSAIAISSILFTKHTAIVSSDKFFEIDLSTYTAEEFVDLSDVSLSHTRNCQPLNAFKISPQEFLLCFTECGIFVDEYGCRSRPYDLDWEYIPTGFIYKEPLLYISHFQIIQIMRIHRSFRNEIALNTGSDDEPNILRAYLNMYMPTLLSESGKRNIYVVTIEKNTNLQELYIIDGVKAFKCGTNISLESLSSQGTCLTLESGPILSSV